MNHYAHLTVLESGFGMEDSQVVAPLEDKVLVELKIHLKCLLLKEFKLLMVLDKMDM